MVRDDDYPEPLVRSLDEALQGADALVIMTRHKEYVEMDLARAKELMASHIIVDGRNTFNGEDVRKLGFYYVGVGKGQFFSWGGEVASGSCINQA